MSTDTQSAPKRVNRFWLWTPWVVFALAAAGWCFYWRAAEEQARAAVASFLASAQARGDGANCDAPTARGFPVLLRLSYPSCVYAPKGAPWRLTSGPIDLHVNLTEPQHVILETHEPINFAMASGVTHVISANEMVVSIRLRGQDLAQAGIEADALSIDNPQAEGVLSASKLVLNIRPLASEAGALQAALETQGLSLPRDVRTFEHFGRDIESLRAALIVTHGDTFLNAENDTPIERWRAAGGHAQVDGVELTWGPLSAKSHGELEIDALHRLDGALDFDIAEPAAPLRALARGEGVSKDARDALGVIAIGLALTHKSASFKVSAQDGWLSIEGAPIRTLGPLY